MRIAIALLTLFPLTASACLWDHDTLRQERSRFPETLELITGKFLRHSPEFYEWRVKDRLAKLREQSSNLGYMDDLAVAYHKTGRHELAVATMLKKEKIAPGQYTTNSNLGTFYILNGELEKGLTYIDRALKIDPDAHFGREKYQKWLVEYAISRKKDGKLTLPLSKERRKGFDSFLLDARHRTERAREETPHYLTEEEVAAAVKGILGIMRFANHDNPLLLEALGDLLRRRTGPSHTDAKRLAARAYLMASYQTDGETSSTYRALASSALSMQLHLVAGDVSLSEVEADFKNQLADADGWYAQLKEKEHGWLAAGLDADAEFDRLYTTDPFSPGDNEVMQAVRDPGLWLILAALLVLAALLGGTIYGVRRFYRWWRQK